MRVVPDHGCTCLRLGAARVVRCAMPDAQDLLGHGPLAVVVPCYDLRTLLLERLPAALTFRRDLDIRGCGPTCTGSHRLIALDLDASDPQEEP